MPSPFTAMHEQLLPIVASNHSHLNISYSSAATCTSRTCIWYSFTIAGHGTTVFSLVFSRLAIYTIIQEIHWSVAYLLYNAKRASEDFGVRHLKQATCHSLGSLFLCIPNVMAPAKMTLLDGSNKIEPHAAPLWHLSVASVGDEQPTAAIPFASKHRSNVADCSSR